MDHLTLLPSHIRINSAARSGVYSQRHCRGRAQQVHEEVGAGGVGEFTAIVYQDTEQFYTETIVTDSGLALPVEVETTEIRQVRR